ncbi:MAG: [Fe-Fe] hydrogenase large subunit C-terminal domain-containing protein, partial [Pseudomonadota bacterium]
MSNSDPHIYRVPYVQVDETLCNGCVLCVKACPTKAIRVRDLKTAQIEGICINCGECVRVCPRRAIKEITPQSVDVFHKEVIGDLVVCPSTVIYSQFGENVLPNDVLLGLNRMGFNYVHDQTYTSELYQFAMELYIGETRKKADSPFPLISPICPVVLWLIAYRFPSLLKRIPPIATPREIVTREAKNRLSAKYGAKPENIKVLHITPCPAVMMAMKENAPPYVPYGDRVMGINKIYETLIKNMQELDDDRILHHSSGVGIGSAMSGGEIAGINRNCLAVSGLHQTIRYLENIEMGLLSEVDYVEFRACLEGCIGGPFTVVDRYRAKRHLQKMIQMFGVEKRIKYAYVKKLYKEGWFFTSRHGLLAGDEPPPLTTSAILERIDRQNRVEEILKLLPRKECSVCGCPDCRTFAEDVA